MATAAALDSYTDFQRFSALRGEANKDPKAALASVAKEFEALFIQMMLKSARDAMPADGEMSSQDEQFYREMFDNQIALQMADEGRLGFKALLARQLPQTKAANDGPVELKLPERKIFPDAAIHYTAVSKPATGDDEVVDIANWQARITDRSFADSQRTFTANMLAHAQRAAERLGTTPEILVAQAALETGWGKNVMRATDGQSSHNLFGIKADASWRGDVARSRTLEYFDGKPVTVTAAFRAYDDFAAAFDDYAGLIAQNPRYREALTHAADPKAYAQALQRAGYATDPNYAQKMLNIHQQIAARGTTPDPG